MESTSTASGRGPFPATRWTLVEEVRCGGEAGQRALGELCAMYWYPVYVYARRGGASPADAEDLTQGFFARLLARESLKAVDAGKGRLRSYLLRALKNFSIGEHHKHNALKRGGGVVMVPIDAEVAEGRFREEPVEIDDPASLFERRWALGLLEEALARLEAEYAQAGKHDLFVALRPMMAGRSQEGDRYATLGEALGMTPGAVQVAVHRLRKRYRSQLEQAVAETVERPEEVDDELRCILRILGS